MKTYEIKIILKVESNPKWIGTAIMENLYTGQGEEMLSIETKEIKE